jgi:hypothetical protein
MREESAARYLIIGSRPRARQPETVAALTSTRFGPTLESEIDKRGNIVVSRLRTILMVLIAIRLLMPPGICVCKWNAPAARFLVSLLQSQRQVPVEDDRDDDHAPGCPASPLAVGMGVKPPSEPVQPPALSLKSSPLESAESIYPTDAGATIHIRFDRPQDPLYLTLRALLI